VTLPDTPKAPPPPPPRIGFNFVVGGGLGLVVGVLMGMTTTPVVGGILAALAALFATIFGVKDNDTSSFARIGGFGLFCVLGVAGGVYLRAHNSLGNNPRQQVAEWTSAGFSDSVARSIVLYREMGLLVNAKGELVPTARADKIVVPTSSTATTLSGATAEECDNMLPSRFGDDAKKIIASYQATGGRWETFANALDGLPPARQTALINAAYALACSAER